jgi:hypothetical protein
MSDPSPLFEDETYLYYPLDPRGFYLVSELFLMGVYVGSGWVPGSPVFVHRVLK